MSIDSAMNDTRKKNIRKRQHQDPPKKVDEGLRRKAHPKIKHTVMPKNEESLEIGFLLTNILPLEVRPILNIYL
jgi:hypothetical protein